MLLYSRNEHLFMTEAQRKCYNTINENNKTLILKKTSKWYYYIIGNICNKRIERRI